MGPINSVGYGLGVFPRSETEAQKTLPRQRPRQIKAFDRKRELARRPQPEPEVSVQWIDDVHHQRRQFS